MIKIKNLIEADTTVSAYIDLESHVYNIEFGTLSDFCRPIHIARNMIMFIDDDGIIGELESIGPRKYMKNSLNLSDAECITGIPAVEYVSPCEEPVQVLNTPQGFVLLLDADMKIDTLYQYKKVSFLVAEGILAGVCWDGGQEGA